MPDVDFPGGSVIKKLPSSAGDVDLIPGLGGSPGEENGNLLLYSCLGNPVNRGVWWAIVHGVSRVRWDVVTKQQQQCLIYTESRSEGKRQLLNPVQLFDSHGL